MRRLLLGSALLLVGLTQTPGLAARAARAAANPAQQAIVECRQMYAGDRGMSGNQTRPTSIESCFRQKTGHYPNELGIPIYPPGYDPAGNGTR